MYRSAIAAVVLAACVLAAPATARAQAYLSEMPSVHVALAKTAGRQRQYATIDRLMAWLQALKGPRDATAAERRLLNAYNTELYALKAGRTPQWVDDALTLEAGKPFARAVMATYFSPAFRARYRDVLLPAPKPPPVHHRHTPPVTQSNPWYNYVIGGAIIVILMALIGQAYRGRWYVAVFRRF